MKKLVRQVFTIIISLALLINTYPVRVVRADEPDENSQRLLNSVYWDLEDLPVTESGNMNTSLFPSYFSFRDGLGTGSTYQVLQENGNKFLKLSGYVEMRLINLVAQPYMFSLDVSTTDNSFAGVFVRATNAFKYPNQDQSSWLYEYDGSGHLGGSGLYVRFDNNSVHLNIKRYNESSKNIINGISTATVNANFQNQMHNVKFLDDGHEKVEIYVDDALVWTVSFSDLGTYPDFGVSDLFYKSAVVKDASDATIATYNDAVIGANSQVGIGKRLRIVDGVEFFLYVDNLAFER